VNKDTIADFILFEKHANQFSVKMKEMDSNID